MRARTTALVVSSFALLVGAGCFGSRERATAYVSAPISSAPSVSPNKPGAEAASGGYETTLTPPLDTVFLVASLPDPQAMNATADEPVETKHPIPLLDGTRGEYTSVERTYIRNKGTDQETRFHVMISDTRSIPVVTAFVNNFEEFTNPDGYRKRIPIGETGAWILYTYDPARSRGGFGGLTILYRNRFLIQINGTLGATESDLVTVANGFDFSKLR